MGRWDDGTPDTHCDLQNRGRAERAGEAEDEGRTFTTGAMHTTGKGKVVQIT